MIFIGPSAFLNGYTGPTVLPTFMVDDFGNELQVIPNACCLLPTSADDQVLVDERSWHQVLRRALRAE